MSFDYSTLITDRTRSDSDTLKALLSKPMAEWTAEERTAFNGAVMKGSYDYTDLNRVDNCLEDLVARLGRVGCNVPGYERLKIERTVTPSSRLPDGYTEVQYIQSTGTQWINTGFKPNQNTRAALTVDAKPSTAAAWLFGARNGNTDRTFGLLSFNSQYRSDYNNSTEEYSTVTPSGKFTVDKDKNVTKFNGTIGVTAKSGVFQCTYPMFLFANNNAGTAAGFGSFKLCVCQLYDNGNLIRDFVPCIDPTGAVGLYDQVEGKFYGNAGTGVFLAGPLRATLPEGYTQLEYIQSSGAQWIDTGFTPDQDTRIIYDCERLSTVSAEHFFGVRTGNSAKEAFCFYIYNSGWRFAYNNYVAAGDGPSTGRYLFDANKNVMTINGSLTLKSTYAKFKASATATLFSMRSFNSGISYGSHKLFSCQIYDNGTLTRNFIPCKNASNAVGLYDTVGAEFYGNAGTGSFTAGPVVTWDEPEEPTETLDPYTWYESDVPVPSQMARYRANVAAVRAALRLPEGTPETPETMRRLTVAEANSIEAILLALNLILSKIHTAVRHCGVTVCGSKGVRA